VSSTTHVFFVTTPVFHHGHYYDHFYRDDNDEIYFEDQVPPRSGCSSAPKPIVHVIDGSADLPSGALDGPGGSG
jgi:hypothetical protein